MLLCQDCSDQAGDAAAGGEDADDVGAAEDLAVQPFLGLSPQVSAALILHGLHRLHGLHGSAVSLL